MAGEGLVSMTPTSIAHSGTSASINADGGVDFTAVTSLSLNGVFTSDYDNYLIVIRHKVAVGGDVVIRYRLRASGVDATAGDYTIQSLLADGSATFQGRISSQTYGRCGYSSATSESGDTAYFYGPALAQATASRNVNISGLNSAAFNDVVTTHSVATSYDGITLYPASSNMTGNVHVFGYEE